MALHHIVTRTVVSLGAMTGLAAAFVAGTSYDGSGSPGSGALRGGPGSDASPAAYSGSGLSLPESCEELLELVRRARGRPGRAVRMGRHGLP